MPRAGTSDTVGLVANPEVSDVATRTAVLEHRAEATDRALDTLHRDLNDGFAALRAQTDQRFEHLNARFDHLNARLDQQLRWVITTVVTTAFAIIGANVGILTLLLRAR